MNTGVSDNRNLIAEGLWHNNPVFRQVLGICSTLAVTNLVLNTAVMSLALIFTLSLSACTVSILRTLTPRNIRMMVETLINWDVKWVWGMVGHSNLGFADAIRRQTRSGALGYFGIRHEGAGAFAASAYGKLTGRPAACFSIAGPGRPTC